MAKHFTKRHIVNGYAAMGASLKRPHYKSTGGGRDIKAAIEAERRKAAREAAARMGKKK